MPRYKLTIAYDGTDFCGWQKQEPPAGMDVAAGKVLDQGGHRPEGDPERPARMTLRTVQEVVERAVREVVREPVMLLGASRTDAGVHARGQVGAFTCSEAAWPLVRGTGALVRAVNSRLPEDVLVVGAEVVGHSFDPISDCTSKGYSYTLHISPHRPLWDRRYVHHVWVPLDVGLMNEAAATIVGEHDFAAFAAAGHGRVSTVRRVFECRVGEGGEEGTKARRHEGATRGEKTDGKEAGVQWEEWGRRVRIEVSGNGFLYNMVRIIAGTLVEVGRGKMRVEDVAAAIESKDRRRAGPTMPAVGLCLEWVRYT